MKAMSRSIDILAAFTVNLVPGSLAIGGSGRRHCSARVVVRPGVAGWLLLRVSFVGLPWVGAVLLLCFRLPAAVASYCSLSFPVVVLFLCCRVGLCCGFC